MNKTESQTPRADRKLRALTSLNQIEQEALLDAFAPLMEAKYKHFTLKGQPRRTPRITERRDSSLFGSARKLSFILMYMKENPNQAYHGYMFDLSQSKVSEWVSFIAPVLEEALTRLGVMPQVGDQYRDQGQELDYLLMDVTERQVPRRSDRDAQQEEYSGKKKLHTVKNLAITDPKGKVLFLSSSYEGTVHDKTLWDDLDIEQTDHNMLTDLGFIGIEHDFPNAIFPFKKPRKAELTQVQKEINRIIGKLRVRIEHAFSGIKRLKIIRNKIRLKSYDARDRMMRIATAIHNLRIDFRSAIQNQP